MPSVIIADDVHPVCEQILQGAGLKVTSARKISEDELASAISSYDGVVVRSRIKITSKIIEGGKDLKIIGRAGVGVDNIDVPAATKRGIVVVNSPSGNTVSASEHTFALLLSLIRKIPDAHQSMRAGKWDRNQFTGTELNGKALGIIGMGRVGTNVARYAKAFGMSVLVYDPFITMARVQELGASTADLETIFTKADVITVHIPLTDKTKNLISTKEIARMKSGVIIVNAARGGIVDEAALAEALNSKKIAGAVVDVYSKEPLSEDSPLRGAQNIIMTPHLGASTQEAQKRVAEDVAREFVEFFKTGTARFSVNLPAVADEDVTPFMHLAYQLGAFAAQISDGRPEKILATYKGILAAKDTGLLTASLMTGILRCIDREGVSIVNSLIHAKERGIGVSENKVNDPQDFRGVVELNIFTDKGMHLVAGTVREDGSHRILRIDDFKTDVCPAPRMLFMVYPDVPGVVGKFGTVLGRNNVNIADMAVGRKAKGKDAVIVVTVDEPVTELVLEELGTAIGGIKTLKYVGIV